MNFLDDLAARRRFGMKPGLETIRALCAAMGDPQRKFRAIHVAGTNGKGAVCALLDAALRSAGLRVGRYTSPHLVRINERFFLDGAPIGDAVLERAAEKVGRAASSLEVTFFEALTAVAYEIYAEAGAEHVVLECGLGGRLDATNVCEPELCVITRIGLDHCDWLGDTVERIAAEKAGIVKPGVPVVLGRNEPSVVEIVRKRAEAVGATFCYAPELVDESEIPADCSLPGAFNRENAVTAIAALKMLFWDDAYKMRAAVAEGLRRVVWPGRFQRVGACLVDGAHNPPAAKALAESLKASGVAPASLEMIAGFCGDKDVAEVLAVLAPFVRRGLAVKTNNPRSLSAEDSAAKMRSAGIDAEPCDSLAKAISTAVGRGGPSQDRPTVLVCGSLFLAGEALVELGAYPWEVRYDPSEALVGETDR